MGNNEIQKSRAKNYEARKYYVVRMAKKKEIKYECK